MNPAPASTPIRAIRCPNPFYRCEINQHARITPCCEIWCRGDVGGLLDGPAQAVWNGAGYQQLRSQMFPGGNPEYFCRANACPHYQSGEWYDLERNLLGFSAARIEEIAAGKTELDSLPSFIEIANDFRCNYQCIMCSARQRTGGTGSDGAEILGRIESLLPRLDNLLLLTSGELFANSGLLDALERLDASKAPELRVSVMTNGSLVTPERWAKLGHLRLDTVMVSVDAATRETYARIRRGGDWDALQRNLAFLARTRREGGFRELLVNMAVMKSNCHEVAAFARAALDWGADRAYFGWVHSLREEMIPERLDWRALEAIVVQLRDPIVRDSRVDAGALFQWERMVLGASKVALLSGDVRDCGDPEHPLARLQEKYREALTGHMAKHIGGYPEARIRWVIRMRRLRDRLPWADRARRRFPGQLGERLFGSRAYHARRRTDREFVADLYHGLLFRAPGPSELDYWEGELMRRTRDQLVREFLASAEFQDTVQQAFQ